MADGARSLVFFSDAAANILSRFPSNRAETFTLLSGAEITMRTSVLFGALLALLALAKPSAGFEPLRPTPVGHEELAWTLDELAGQLHGLGARWREHFFSREPSSERPLITLMLRHRDELGLSPEQIRRLEQLRVDFQREAIRREADLRVA